MYTEHGVCTLNLLLTSMCLAPSGWDLSQGHKLTITFKQHNAILILTMGAVGLVP